MAWERGRPARAEYRAAKTPLQLLSAQTRRHQVVLGVVLDVLYRALEALLVPNVAVEGFLLPELAAAPENPVGPLRSEGFPRVHNDRKAPAGTGSKNSAEYCNIFHCRGAEAQRKPLRLCVSAVSPELCAGKCSRSSPGNESASRKVTNWGMLPP